MIHYHGLPITPETAAIPVLSAGHGFVSFADPRNLALVASICQSFAVDNGAFSAWRKGKPILDWSEFYEWVVECHRMPSCDFAVIPDVIDGDEAANDKLLDEWPLPHWFGAPVWHMHESVGRLHRLSRNYPRICIGSSGRFAQVGSVEWWARMHRVMRVVCDDDGRPHTKLHGLRMLDPKVFSRVPFASADSTNIARNVGLDQRWKTGSYQPPTKEARAQVMRSRIESHNSPTTWTFPSCTSLLPSPLTPSP